MFRPFGIASYEETYCIGSAKLDALIVEWHALQPPPQGLGRPLDVTLAQSNQTPKVQSVIGPLGIGLFDLLHRLVKLVKLDERLDSLSHRGLVARGICTD